MSKLSLKVFRGRIVHCLEVKSVTVLEDGLIGIDSNGQVDSSDLIAATFNRLTISINFYSYRYCLLMKELRKMH